MKTASPIAYAHRRPVILANVRHGSPLAGRENLIYAEVHDADTGDLLMGATLGDILKVIDERGYHFVKAQ